MRRALLLLCIAATLMTAAHTQDRLEGDSCVIRDSPGTCRLGSRCPLLEIAFRSGKIKNSEIVHCGIGIREEIVCCPDTDIFGENSAASTTTTTTSPTSTSTATTTTHVANSDLEQTIRELLARQTTTTAKPDFWLDLLTTTTTTVKPDFWLDLLTSTTAQTTTTTTTAQPLRVGGKELDTGSEFYDFSKLLNAKKPAGQEAGSGSVPSPNHLPPPLQHATNPHGAGVMPARPNQNTFAPNTPFFPQNPNTRHEAGNNPINPGFPPLSQGGRQFQQNQRPFSPPNSNMHHNNAVPRQPGFHRPGGVGNGHFRNGGRDNRRWSTNDVERNFNEGPAIREEWTSTNDVELLPERQNFHSLDSVPANSIPDRLIMPAGHQSISPGFDFGFNAPHNPAAPVRNPIDFVNQNLINSGMNIVKADLTNFEGFRQPNPPRTMPNQPAPREVAAQPQWAQQSVSTPATTILDPFAAFQFRPQLTEVNGNSIEPVSSSAGIGERPLIDANDTTSPTTSTTTQTPVITRTDDRPAVRACRRIDAGLTASISQHVLGGTPAELGEFPHVAAIGFRPIGALPGIYDYSCGGALISNRFVLSAAHCFVRQRPEVVLLGLVDFADTESSILVPVREIHNHPNYTNARKYDDIALLELEREVIFNHYVYPICLYTDLADPTDNWPLYVTGWGVLNVTTRARSTQLLKAKLQTQSIEACNVSFSAAGPTRQIDQGILATQMCAYDPGFTKDACQGDSGGPLNLVMDESLLQYRIVGIVSAGFSCGSRTPGLYTRVAAYLDFIESIVWPGRGI